MVFKKYQKKFSMLTESDIHEQDSQFDSFNEQYS